MDGNKNNKLCVNGLPCNEKITPLHTTSYNTVQKCIYIITYGHPDIQPMHTQLWKQHFFGNNRRCLSM